VIRNPPSHFPLRLLFCLLAGTIPVSCVKVPIKQRVIEIHHYSIDPRPASDVAPAPADLSLLVQPFQGNAQQRGDRMLYSDELHEMDFYFYNRWTAPPEKMIGDALIEDLMDWGFFKQGVFQGDAAITPTHEVQGRVIKLYADNRSGDPTAVFEASLTVLRVDSRPYRKTIIYQQTFPVTVDRKNRSIKSYVEATNGAVRIWLDQVRSELDYLLRHPEVAADSTRTAPGSPHQAP
jgi:ABC-type uncharacterized transport system auxiliary subunit